MVGTGAQGHGELQGHRVHITSNMVQATDPFAYLRLLGTLMPWKPVVSPVFGSFAGACNLLTSNTKSSLHSYTATKVQVCRHTV